MASMFLKGGRRDFIKGAALFGASTALANQKGDSPILRVAVLSDLQGHPHPEDAGMRNLERALDVLAPLKPDVVVSAGDMNDNGRDAEAVRYFKGRCDARLGTLPHIACIGNHELGFLPEELRAVRTSEVCRKDFCDVFGDPPELVLRKTIGGYDFISLSLSDEKGYLKEELSILKDALDASVRRDATKPVFVVSHYHPYDTVNSSANIRADGGLRKLLDDYPQVVNLSGHTHNPLQDPRSIWQGNFTVIETSTLCYGCIANKPPAVNQVSVLLPYGHESVGCLFLEVFQSRIVVHRFSVRDRREIEPENPWEIPWPHTPYRPRYAFGSRKASEIAPEFAGDPEPTIWYDYGYVYLMFNAAADPARTYGYRVELTDDVGTSKSYFHVSDFYRVAAHRQSRIVFKAPPHSLASGKAYRCRIFPVGFFGAEGRPIDWKFRIRPGYPCRNDIPNFIQE